jgi:hypothetical protein
MARTSLNVWSLLSAVALVVGVSGPAHAGFEWIAPPAPAVAVTPENSAAAPSMPAMPRDKVEVLDVPLLEPVAPQTETRMIMPPNSLSSAPIGMQAATPHERPATVPARQRPPLSEMQKEAMAPAVASAPLAAPVLSEPAAVQAAPVLAEAVGFGSDIPLVLAMRQIVPPDYAFSFDPAIDQGARVTWNGGKPWDQVLNEALLPLQAVAYIDGKTVRVMPVSAQRLPERVVADLPSPMQAAPMMTEPTPQTPAQEVYVRRTTGSERSFWSRLKFWDSSDEEMPKKEVVVRNPAPLHHAPTPLVPVETGVPNTATSVAPQGSGQTPTFWQAERGDSLKNVLETWADEAGVRLYWVALQDYPLPAAIRVEGSFTDAVTKVLSSYGESGSRPVGRLHPNLPDGPAALIIEPVSG